MKSGALFSHRARRAANENAAVSRGAAAVSAFARGGEGAAALAIGGDAPRVAPIPMRPRITFPRLILAAALLWLAGCATTPESRIGRNPEAFAKLTPAQQALVKAGEVAVGFDEEMVRLAVGEPNRKWIRTDASGSGEVWSYTTWGDAGGPPYPGWYRGFYGPMPGYYPDYRERHEREYLRVVFKGGKVTAVESETR